jgi:hypothetical protein
MGISPRFSAPTETILPGQSGFPSIISGGRPADRYASFCSTRERMASVAAADVPTWIAIRVPSAEMMPGNRPSNVSSPAASLTAARGAANVTLCLSLARQPHDTVLEVADGRDHIDLRLISNRAVRGRDCDRRGHMPAPVTSDRIFGEREFASDRRTIRARDQLGVD